MAMLPPHLLTYQHAAPGVTFGMEGWQEQSSHLIKQLYYNWRPRTAELFQLATGHRDRFDPKYVANLIREELGEFFRRSDPNQQEQKRYSGGRLDEMLAGVANAAVVADSCFQSSAVEWQILFTDPVTGKITGFPYQGPAQRVTQIEEARYLMDMVPMQVMVDLWGGNSDDERVEEENAGAVGIVT
ncbi:hypothetical protein F5144DRAFT_499289 [Chaetomium tenue]|uniref:Uncharacterized protein n=1 Tax=Chaetomium tenue TaxID=1854479 RepID=A0ACB7NZE0_9PEZI|nr:hypothetical protein F5144DRAFT_499289 [Chaetomium globosum]